MAQDHRAGRLNPSRSGTCGIGVVYTMFSWRRCLRSNVFRLLVTTPASFYAPELAWYLSKDDEKSYPRLF